MSSERSPFGFRAMVGPEVVARPDLPYMTESEGRAFKAARSSGKITIYRVAKCEKCGAETLKHKRFCSRKCWAAEAGDGEK